MITKDNVRINDIVTNGVTYGEVIYIDEYVVEVKWADKGTPVRYEEPWMFNLRMKAGRFKLANDVVESQGNT